MEMNSKVIAGIDYSTSSPCICINVGDEYDFHYFGWNFEFLEEYLTIAGFKKIEKVKSFSLFNDTSNFAPYSGVPISLNVIAYK